MEWSSDWRFKIEVMVDEITENHSVIKLAVGM
jgi:hypothetical protein